MASRSVLHRLQSAPRALALGTLVAAGVALSVLVGVATMLALGAGPQGLRIGLVTSLLAALPVAIPAAVLIDALMRDAHEARREAWRLTGIDALTGALNRSRFVEIAEPAVAAAHAQGDRAALLLLDLDDFRRVNDLHGHAAGDALLRAAAAVCAATLRDGELFARWGSAEFAMLLPGRSADEAARLAERLRLVVAACAVPGAAGPLANTTASIGLAIAGPSVPTLDALVSVAGRALHAAQRRGRDRVVRRIDALAA